MCSSCLLLSSFKVSLAAQTLSNSVAVALRTLQDVGYAEFRDSEATSEFIKVMQLICWSATKRGWLLNVNDTRINPYLFFFHFWHQERLNNYDLPQIQQYARTWLKLFIPTTYFPQKHPYCHISDLQV